MTSNGDSVLNASSLPAAALDDRSRSTPSPRRTASKAASPWSKENRPLPPNGDHEHDDAQNESEAETVVLSPEKKAIKTERNDDDDDARLRSIKEESRALTPLSNGQRRSS